MSLETSTENKEVKFEEQIAEVTESIVRWSNNPELEMADMLEIRFVASSGATFRKLLTAKDKIVVKEKVASFVESNLCTAKTHFGEIVGVMLGGSKMAMAKFGFNGYRPGLPRKSEGTDQSNGNGAGATSVLAKIRAEKPLIKVPRRVDYSHLFNQLENRPENLKATILEKLKRRRAMLLTSGLVTCRDNQIEAL
ncbi:hypothetical protein IT411_03740, partial [Candidatus Peregrinibacteria bacterium]|nr:hypothetical protein [Candidatus Peregrinibacteria bacterium]